jgi:hypothetical protein
MGVSAASVIEILATRNGLNRPSNGEDTALRRLNTLFYSSHSCESIRMSTDNRRVCYWPHTFARDDSNG